MLLRGWLHEIIWEVKLLKTRSDLVLVALCTICTIYSFLIQSYACGAIVRNNLTITKYEMDTTSVLSLRTQLKIRRLLFWKKCAKYIVQIFVHVYYIYGSNCKSICFPLGIQTKWLKLVAEASVPAEWITDFIHWAIIDIINLFCGFTNDRNMA